MYLPKRYGQSRIDTCPFCGKQSVTENSQGVPVCLEHKKNELNDVKCLCGGWLDLKKGKYGPFFTCIKCGNVNFKRALEMNPKKREVTPQPVEKERPKGPREITITSDEVDLY